MTKTVVTLFAGGAGREFVPTARGDDMSDPQIQLMHGDCLELMALIPDNSVDAIVCDLPKTSHL